MYSSTCFTYGQARRELNFDELRASYSHVCCIVIYVIYLLAVLSSRGIERLNEIRRVSEEKSVTRCAADHAEHGEPHVGQGLWRKPTVPDTQHVRHGFEESPRVLFQPKRVLQVGVTS